MSAGGTGVDQYGAASRPLILKGLSTLRNPETYQFIITSVTIRRATSALLKRFKVRTSDRGVPLGTGVLLKQLQAIQAWGQEALRLAFSIEGLEFAA